MIHQKLIEILECLDEENLKSLELFLLSPYFNDTYNKNQIIDLYQFLIAPKQLKELSKVDKEKLSLKFFPTHKYKPKQKNPIDALASDLFKLVQEFIHIEMAKKDNYESKRFLYLARFYLRNNSPLRFQQNVSRFIKYQKSRNDVGPRFYLDRFLIEFEVASFMSIFNTYTEDINLVTVHQSLDQFYKVSKLELSALLKFQKKLGSIDDQGILEKTQFVFSKDNDSDDDNLLNGYYQSIIDWLDNPPSLEEIQLFSVNVLSNRNLIESNAVRNIMAFQRNFYLQAYRLQVDSNVYLLELFKVYKFHLEEGFFLVNEKILPTSLNSIIAIALKCGEIEWAKEVIKNYPPERIIGTNYAEEAHCLCEAEVFFVNQEYDLALEKLVYKNFENVNYSIMVDILLIRIYYMTNDDLVYNRIRAIEQKIRRSKVANTRQASYLNFIKLLNQVLKYQHNKKANKWIKLVDKLEKTSNVVHREWLLQVINQ